MLNFKSQSCVQIDAESKPDCKLKLYSFEVISDIMGKNW